MKKNEKRIQKILWIIIILFLIERIFFSNFFLLFSNKLLWNINAKENFNYTNQGLTGQDYNLLVLELNSKCNTQKNFHCYNYLSSADLENAYFFSNNKSFNELLTLRSNIESEGDISTYVLTKEPLKKIALNFNEYVPNINICEDPDMKYNSCSFSTKKTIKLDDYKKTEDPLVNELNIVKDNEEIKINASLKSTDNVSLVIILNNKLGKLRIPNFVLEKTIATEQTKVEFQENILINETLFEKELLVLIYTKDDFYAKVVQISKQGSIIKQEVLN